MTITMLMSVPIKYYDGLVAPMGGSPSVPDRSFCDTQRARNLRVPCECVDIRVFT